MTTAPTDSRLYGQRFRDDPHRVYDQLRAAYGPVAPVELEPGVTAWLVTDYATIARWCRDGETFSRDARRWRDLREGHIPDSAGVLPMMGWRPSAIFTDGEEHARLRRSITETVGAVDTRRVAADTRELSHRLVDTFCARGHAELLDDYARLLPLLVVNRMFGFSDQDGMRITAALRDLWDLDQDPERANERYVQALGAAMNQKHHHPDEDVTTWLMRHRAGLSDEEVLGQLALIIGASNEATANLIANAARIILTDRDLGGDIVEARISVDDAIDRVLWHEPPVANYPILYSRHDIQLANGMTVREGDPIIMGLEAANHALAGSHADQLAGTANRAHLSFGVGPHACPSKQLGRDIAATGIQTLLERLPQVRLAVSKSELTWRDSPFSRALSSLPLAFTPSTPTNDNGALPWNTETSSSAPTPARTTPAASTGAVRSSKWNFLARWLRGR